jgi:multiple antibiotic resistance protein
VTGLAIRTFLTMLVVIDPLGLVPMFLALAGERPAAEQRRIALRAITIAAGILVSFGIGGSWLLDQLEISLDAFRIAGGLLLFRISAQMVFAAYERETKEEKAESLARRDISVFPLAIPIIAGPGAIASLMILIGESRAYPLGFLLVLAMTGIVLVLGHIALVVSEPIGRLLGQTGVNVVTRVLGVLLAALAVQYVADGVRGLLR